MLKWSARAGARGTRRSTPDQRGFSLEQIPPIAIGNAWYGLVEAWVEAFKLTNCELNGERLTKVVRERLAVVRGAGSDTRPGVQEGSRRRLGLATQNREVGTDSRGWRAANPQFLRLPPPSTARPCLNSHVLLIHTGQPDPRQQHLPDTT